MENINKVIQYYKMNQKEDFKREVVEHLGDKASVIKLLNNKCIRFLEIADKLKNDRELSLLAVKKNGTNFKYINSEFYKDRDIIVAALKYKYADFEHIFENIPSEILNETEIAEYCLKHDFKTLKYLEPHYADNKELLIKINVVSLEYMSERLKKDREIVLHCVSQLGHKLQFASTDFQDDYDVVLVAVKNEGDALRYASERLRTDPKIVKAAIRNDWSATRYISDEAKNNKEIILYAIKKDFNNLQYASPKLQEYYMDNPINW